MYEFLFQQIKIWAKFLLKVTLIIIKFQKVTDK